MTRTLIVPSDYANDDVRDEDDSCRISTVRTILGLRNIHIVCFLAVSSCPGPYSKRLQTRCARYAATSTPTNQTRRERYAVTDNTGTLESRRRRPRQRPE